jgi:serine/threonine-protein kinase RsbT
VTAQSADGPDALPIRTDADVVRVRQAVRALAVAAQLSLVEQTKVVTAASELARTTLTHGRGGTATVRLITEGGSSGVRAVFCDQGPESRTSTSL